MNPITLFLVIACALAGLALGKMVDIYLAPPFLVAAVIIALSLKMADARQKFVILRAGKLPPRRSFKVTGRGCPQAAIFRRLAGRSRRQTSSP
jgi:hypothetical protein